eukprot:CAMPEP_0179256582 /NCGR_PEP_ID=MMETSP0797-20121207/24344_1 /TAXON_ID=47934 /ORGANISM="Dinophysis acuminata, Strain DAEP01" /LENGTH=131 /DNA_ID=CAMNT_0020964527 /DNA_START=129 /DNA_END=521 /DNA_ORIENTATION=+
MLYGRSGGAAAAGTAWGSLGGSTGRASVHVFQLGFSVLKLLVEALGEEMEGPVDLPLRRARREELEALVIGELHALRGRDRARPVRQVHLGREDDAGYGGVRAGVLVLLVPRGELAEALRVGDVVHQHHGV